MSDSGYCYGLAFWVICGLIAGYIYQKKGRSQGAGCLAGFFLGPLGIILALLSSTDQGGLVKQEALKEQQKLQSGQLKKCPYCAELIKPEAIVCRYCGKDLSQNPTPTPPAKVALPSQPAPVKQPQPVAPAPHKPSLLSKVQESITPKCPTCGVTMTIKTGGAGAGKDEGKKFYVCPNYKTCKNFFPVENNIETL